MSVTTATSSAAGWCCCRENHQEYKPCPGHLRQEDDQASLYCTYCGSKYHADVLDCESIICSRCNGKRH